MKCWSSNCGQEIDGEPTWLAHDGGYDGSDPAERKARERVYPLHRNCAKQPWPMYEVTPEEAKLIKRGDE